MWRLGMEPKACLAGALNGSFGSSWDWEIGAQFSENDFFVTAKPHAVATHPDE